MKETFGEYDGWKSHIDYAEYIERLLAERTLGWSSTRPRKRRVVRWWERVRGWFSAKENG